MGKKKKIRNPGTNVPPQPTVPPMPLVMTYRGTPVDSYRREDGKLYCVPLPSQEYQYLRCLRDIINIRLEQARAENARLNYESDCHMTYEIASVSGMIGGLKFCLEEIDKILYPDEEGD